MGCLTINYNKTFSGLQALLYDAYSVQSSVVDEREEVEEEEEEEEEVM